VICRESNVVTIPGNLAMPTQTESHEIDDSLRSVLLSNGNRPGVTAREVDDELP
jgi:hypothetical protein